MKRKAEPGVDEAVLQAAIEVHRQLELRGQILALAEQGVAICGSERAAAFALDDDPRNLVLVSVFVGQFDLDAIIMHSITDGAEHSVVDGFVLQQNRQ